MCLTVIYKSFLSYTLLIYEIHVINDSFIIIKLVIPEHFFNQIYLKLLTKSNYMDYYALADRYNYSSTNLLLFLHNSLNFSLNKPQF